MATSNKTVPKVRSGDYLTREEALALLGVKLQTFYTYASRGLIRRHEIAGHKRKLYLKSDIERLAAKSQARTKSGAKAGDAMRYGSPIFQTWICEITPEGPRYRNRLAIDLARSNLAFEQIVELLCTGQMRAQHVPWKVSALPPDFTYWANQSRRLGAAGRDDPAHTLIFLLTSLRAIGPREDPSATGNTLPLAFQLLQILAGAAGYLGPQGRFSPLREGETIAERIASSLSPSVRPEVVAAINAALILCAEHELAPPTFAVRVCASTGADLYACLSTGLLAHTGHLQGGGTDGAEDLLDQILAPGGIRKLSQAQWASPFDFPGFNHPLYQRDPRSVVLLEMAERLVSGKSGERMLALIRKIETDTHFFPGITAALVMLTRAMGLPRRAANLIFSVGRSAGWIAHMLEQRMAGYMLRPRAHFSTPVESGAPTGMK